MPDSLLAGYGLSPTRYDELCAAPGELRPHWRGFLHEFAARGAAQLGERMALVEREVRENGITYNVYADPLGADRPWEVDPVPLLLAPEDWARLEAGVAQRARLLDAILADLYGEQALLREGLIPPALVFGHPGYLAPVRGIRPPGGIHLFQYAADLARSPDGRWWVFSDRTQAPSGAGYALENRLIVSRMFPESFRELGVEHLAAFFAGWRDAIAALAPRGDGPQLTALLTPGPWNETYFEHALLARYLGFVLVEGSDLTVRHGRVWLKTVEGLKRVHAIVRRQDDDYCDPLELRADSALGIPGLTDCARRGTVLLANALGSGVLESGALMGFLPRLCERLLGEELRLPSVASWWLGEAAALEDAWPRLDELIVKAVDRGAGKDQDIRTGGSTEQREALRARVRQQPHRFVAQEWVRLSQAPALDPAQPGRLAPRAVGLRVFAAASPQGWRVMPGGLVRMGRSAEADVIGMQRGGASKDAWVLPAGPPAPQLSLLRTTVTPADLAAPRAHLSSRGAENLFWFGRYAERAECTARLLRVALARSVSETGAGDGDADTGAALALARRWGIGLPGRDELPAELVRAATTAPQGLGGVLAQLGRVAFSLRERLSLDHWRTLNQLLHDPVLARGASLPAALAWLDRAVTALVTQSGFALDGMTRGTDWRFMSIGRRIERIAFVCSALRTAMEQGGGLEWLLELCDSSVTYRSRYMVAPEWLPVLDLLVRDAGNPRSVGFHLPGLLDAVRELEAQHGGFGGALLAASAEALARLEPQRLRPDDASMRALLDAVQDAVYRLSDALGHKFFVHAPARSVMQFPV
ncbi:circularly permuted type 2 ATP-grasp protein [Caldimonas tepidiphila]|uniref:circularly permuted type 2 ATP-grasp protein n=1 Tax=Caldimonas tepidiphila TaxID=2315841 RepID=UPI000E5B7D71|nr:circularly permuted type 2 ATP-grasp protein [Caldimonas tepidiphila]